MRTQKSTQMRTMEPSSSGQETDAISAILSRSSRVSTALKEVYEYRKFKNPRISLAYLSRKCGLSSKSNLSDIFHGRRKLGKKYRAALLKHLGLVGLPSTFLHKMMEYEFDKSLSKKDQLDELNLLRKALNISMVSHAFMVEPFCFYLFCSLGLFGNRASEENLVSYFRSHSREEVLTGLRHLQSQGFIEKTGGTFSPTKNQVMFRGSDAKSHHLAFLKQGFAESGDACERYFSVSEWSHFESTIVSVDQGHFKAELKKFKEALLKFQATIESEKSNMLVRVNVGLYPVE